MVEGSTAPQLELGLAEQREEGKYPRSSERVTVSIFWLVNNVVCRIVEKEREEGEVEEKEEGKEEVKWSR